MKIVLLSFFFGLAGCAAQAQSTGMIELEVSGVPSEEGDVLAALFDDPNGFPSEVSKGVMKASAAVSQGKSSLVFNDVPYGSYVLAVFHDANGNGLLDTNSRGIPLEALGVSNNIRLKLGPPKYDKAQFDLSSQKLQMAIEMQQYKAGK